jgi:hypothetical protein
MPFVQTYVEPYLDVVVAVLVLGTVLPLLISSLLSRRRAAAADVPAATLPEGSAATLH